MKWAALAALLPFVAAQTRKMNVRIKVVECQGLAYTPGKNPSNYPMQPYGYIYLDNDLSNVAKASQYFVPDANDIVSFVSGNGEERFSWSACNAHIDGNTTRVKLYSYTQGDEATWIVLGWMNFTLPKYSDLTSFSESKYGAPAEYGTVQTMSVMNPPYGSSRGSCKLQLQMYANQCEAGEYVNPKSSPCQICPAGSKCSGFTKSLCEKGSYSGSGADECQACDAGYQCKNPGSTSPTTDKCPAGQFSYSGDSSCQKCMHGYYGAGLLPATDLTCDGPCKEGYFCGAGSTSATQNRCPGGQYSKEGASACEPCREGFYGSEGSSDDKCNAVCPAGYVCPTGSSAPVTCNKDVSADNLFFCEEGSASGKMVRRGYYGTPEADPATLQSEEICHAGHRCQGGRQERCPHGYYQPEMGETDCLAWECPKDHFIDAEASDSLQVQCKTCGLTLLENNCPDGTVFFGCDGESLVDNAECVVCNITDSSNETAHTACQRSNVTNTLLNQTTVQEGIKPWLIGVVCGVVSLIFMIIIALIVRNRRKMRERMEELDRKNRSFEDDQDLAISLENNFNPMFSKTKVVNDTSASDKLHAKEVKELNKHKRALENEVKRLKKEVQVNEIDNAVGARQSGGNKKKKKEFTGGDMALH